MLPVVEERPARAAAARLDAAGLAAELRRTIAGEVRFDAGSRALYATDLSVYRQVPIGVVIPRTVEDVVETVAACRRWGAPILGRGCGTSLAGQCCNVAVVIDFSKYLNRILEVDPAGRFAWVEPGVINDQLQVAARPHGLLFAPDPATHQYCTIGGMLGNNSCGAHTVMGGKTVDNVEELEVLTYDGTVLRVGATGPEELERLVGQGGRTGEIYSRLVALRDRYADRIRERFPDIPRRVSGYNLDELLPERGFHVARALVGSESTCALVLRAKLRLIPSPPGRALLVIGYPEPWLAADHVPEIRDRGPLALEAVTAHVLENMARKGKPLLGGEFLPGGKTWLLVEFGGDSPAEAADRAREVRDWIERSGGDRVGTTVVTDVGEQQAVWEVREAGVGASRVPGIEDAWPGWEDAAVAPERLGDYLREFIPLLRRYGYAYSLYGHFGDGCIHCRITFDLKTAAGVQRYRSFMSDAADLVLSFGGSLSGEHGDGQARAEFLPRMFGPDLVQAFREFKSIWDPEGRMNPGKVVDPYPLDSNLRTGPDYNPIPVSTHFRFPDDHGSFAAATERCFGVGKCRRLEAGTMCPSFMATREEQHTTRGRAHLLFEMLRGEAITDGWKSEAVKESLDLCLACKGCKGECPVSVDIATYKAEFLSHYYEGRLRPPAAYTLGQVFRWARVAALAPGVANLVLRTPALAGPVKRMLGLAGERELPAFARQTFRAWWWRRGGRGVSPRPDGAGRVVLWPDTFNNHFSPQTARAAVAVLEAAGLEVEVPVQPLCCGRPLYDYGMLDQAKRRLGEILEALRPAVRAGVPVVGLEPSCVAVFRDELGNLLPNDEDARRLGRQVFTLGEFLEQMRGSRDFPRLRGRALLHGHCHQKALIGMQPDERVLSDLGLDVATLDSGCCGLAGSFGYEAAHYDVSMRAGERVLLPAVRDASPNTFIVADGFSCRTQIEHATPRRALHLAEVLALALRQPERGGEGVPYPEREIAPEPARPPSAPAIAAGLLVAGAATTLLVRALTARSRG
ncbi:MAG TPA: FAD-linked oxidase C-terminal domain-containing protein [Longimicrobiales bacterium]